MRGNKRMSYLLAATSVLCIAGVVLSVGCQQQQGKPSIMNIGDGSKPLKEVVNPGNKAFYKADGSFDAAAVKKAYFAMLEAYNAPIHPQLKTDEFWVCDFLSRDHEKLGMGGIFWVNMEASYGDDTDPGKYDGEYKGQKFGYLGHEIYLLPGQMLPEHRHIGGEKGYGPKMESWHIRYGTVEFFGEYKGDGTEKPISEMAEKDRPWGYGEPWFKSKYVTSKSAGGIYTLTAPETWHFQRAGPNGAIVSEYATFHNQVEFSKPGMKFASSEAK